MIELKEETGADSTAVDTYVTETHETTETNEQVMLDEEEKKVEEAEEPKSNKKKSNVKASSSSSSVTNGKAKAAENGTKHEETPANEVDSKEKGSPRRAAKRKIADEAPAESAKPSKSSKAEKQDEQNEEEAEISVAEKSLIVEGKRQRKNVERLQLTEAPKETPKLTIPEGKGVKLGEIPRILYFIDKADPETMRLMHRILIGPHGKKFELKRHIRQFSGFAFERESPEFEKKRESFAHLTMYGLKCVCTVLDLERSGTKEELIERILKFLLEPQDSGKSVPKPKSKKSKGSKKSGGDKKKKSGDGKKSAGGSPVKGVKSKETIDDEDDESDESDKSLDESGLSKSMNETAESIEDETKEESEKEKPKKKSPVKTTPKATGKKEAKKTPIKIVLATPKSTAAKQAKAATPAKSPAKTPDPKTKKAEPVAKTTPAKQAKKPANKKVKDEDEEDEAINGEKNVKTVEEEAKPVKEEKEEVKPVKTASNNNVTKTNGSSSPAKATNGNKSPEKNGNGKTVHEDDSEEDDMPLSKLIKPKQMPTEDELRQTIKDFVTSSDLDTITMKKVINEVQSKYSGYDLKEKTAFIKSTVNKLIEELVN